MTRVLGTHTSFAVNAMHWYIGGLEKGHAIASFACEERANDDAMSGTDGVVCDAHVASHNSL